MPWCPNCKNEYRAGITFCSDCNELLVEDLNTKEEKLKEATVLLCKTEGNHAGFITKLVDFLEYSGVTAKVVTEPDGMVAAYTTEKEFRDAKRLFRAYYSVEMERMEAMDEEEQEMDEDWADDYFGDDDEDEDVVTTKKSALKEESVPAEPQAEDSRKYGGAVARYENYKSSGSVFCILGGIGLFIGILNYMDVLPIMSNTFSSLVFIGIFGLFVALGIVSYQKAGTLKDAADKELEVTNAIKEWLEKNVTEAALAECDKKQKASSDSVDMEDADAVSELEEFLYLNRIEMLTEKLMKAFPDADQVLAEELLEEFYAKKFD